MNKLKIALVVGHSKKSQGAVNKTTGITEWKFNNRLVNDIIYDFIILKKDYNINFIKIIRKELKYLPDIINKKNPDIVICFHANAFDTKTSGCETLYYHTSEKGELIAKIIQGSIVRDTKLKDRGIKPKTSEDRGGFILKNTNAPCVILEPFFIDNDIEFDYINNIYLYETILNAILEVYKELLKKRR